MKKHRHGTVCVDCNNKKRRGEGNSLTLHARSLVQQQGQRLTPLQRYSIIAYLAIGWSFEAIASFIQRDVRAVKRWVGRMGEEVIDHHRSGRSSTMKEEEKTLIVARAVEDPFVTPAMIKNELDLSCSDRTVDRILQEAGLFGRVAKRSYPYTDSQKQVRLAFSSSMLCAVAIDSSYWEKVFFTDETSLELGMNGNRVYVRRPRGEMYKFAEEYTWKDEGKIKSGKVKLFAGFSYHGVGELYFYEKMTGKEMVEIVKKNIVPSMKQFNSVFVLHDNDKKFRCHVVTDYRRKHGVLQLNDEIWPAYSPDLNPIENLWSDLQSRVFDRNPCGVEELKEFIIDEWPKTDSKLLKKLAYSMTKRCLMVIAVNGARIKY